MNKKTIIVALLTPLISTVLFCGCATMQPQRVPRTAVFNEDEYATYAGDGTATITGQAFVKTRGGDVKFGAGNKVFLNPVTTYSTEWYQKYVIGGIPSPNQTRGCTNTIGAPSLMAMAILNSQISRPENTI